jgi:mannose-6-phosphate isomerase-like protein (cupin superfamily)
MQIVNHHSPQLRDGRSWTRATDPLTDIVTLEPGAELCRRASNAAIVLVMAGTIQLRRGEVREPVTTGTVTILPSGSPQILRNTGVASARLIIHTQPVSTLPVTPVQRAIVPGASAAAD